MTDLCRRTSAADLEIRSDGRTVVGLAVPFDTPTRILGAGGTFTEVFRRGSFERTIAERGDRVKFLLNHDRQSLPVGRATLLREDAAGLYLEARVSKTTTGDEALELIRDGALDAFSIGFHPVKDRWSDSSRMVERLEAKLVEVTVTGFPAYEDALISGVRSENGDPFGLTVSAALSRLQLLTPLVPLVEARQRLAALERSTYDRP